MCDFLLIDYWAADKLMKAMVYTGIVANKLNKFVKNAFYFRTLQSYDFTKWYKMVQSYG